MDPRYDQTVQSAFPFHSDEPVRRVSARLFPYNLATRSPVAVVDLERPRVRIGRASSSLPVNSVIPPEPEKVIIDNTDAGVDIWGDPSISRDHARVERVAGEWVIIDENSTNGTYVDGVRVLSCVLRDGDRVRIGNTAQFHFCVVHEVVELSS